MRYLVAAALVSSLIGGSVRVAAQSLGEAAEKEKQRKRTGTAPVYTIDDISKPSPSPSPSPSSKKPGASPAAPATPPPMRPRPARTPTPTIERQTPDPDQVPEDLSKIWRERAGLARAAVQQAELLVTTKQAELGALMSDLMPTDLGDPNREQNREAKKVKVRKELADAEATLAAARQAVVDLEETARREAVPPGWLR